jgi:hypothetical protein
MFSVIIDSYQLLSINIDGYSVRRLSTCQAVRGSNAGGDEIFRTCPDRPRSPPSLPYNAYRVSFPGVKRPGRGVDHLPHPAPRLKKTLEKYNTFLSAPSWPLWDELYLDFTVVGGAARQYYNRMSYNGHVANMYTLICVHTRIA